MVGRRGATCIPVHFSGRPQTSDTSEWLCQDIVEALAPSGVVGRLYVCPFGDKQREISLAVPQSLRIIMYRRLMFQVAERVAALEGAKALVTGESLGQVASQTLENIWAVDECVGIPVLRPLIGSESFDHAGMLEDLVANIEYKDFSQCPSYHAPRGRLRAHHSELGPALEKEKAGE